MSDNRYHALPATEQPPETANYDIGYSKPPAQHRFQKGRSGNPHGRPKRAKVQMPKGHALEFGSQPANQLLLAEAYRSVTVREGENTIELPAIQAVFRAMGVAAIKGNRFAQRTMTELIQQIESADRQLRAEYMETMITYKASWGQAIENAKARGWTEPQPVPHPNDIIIDLNMATAHICGPKTEEEKTRWDRSLMRRDDAQLEVSDYAERYRRARDPKRKQMYLEEWHSEQKLFDIINDNLPPRYRATLRDRSKKEGASLPGTQKRNHWPGE